MNYKDVENIVKLGEWAYKEIPEGALCNNCPLLGKPGRNAKSPYCNLRPVFALNHDSSTGEVFKDSQCPKPKGAK